VHLDVLARREVEEVVAEVRVRDRTVCEIPGDPTYCLHLFGLQHPAWHLHAHHERVAALLLRVDANPLQPLDLARDPVHRREVLGVGLYDRLTDLERVALEFDLLYLV
jgi:hypothetical protein